MLGSIKTDGPSKNKGRDVVRFSFCNITVTQMQLCRGKKESSPFLWWPFPRLSQPSKVIIVTITKRPNFRPLIETFWPYFTFQDNFGGVIFALALLIDKCIVGVHDSIKRCYRHSKCHHQMKLLFYISFALILADFRIKDDHVTENDDLFWYRVIIKRYKHLKVRIFPKCSNFYIPQSQD